MNPARFTARVSTIGLSRRPVDRDDLERAQEIFDEFAPLSFGIDLGDLSDKAWSLTPGGGDFIADMHTDRYGTLTFAQSANQPEDVALFERDTQRIIALYSSAQKRAVQGRYFSEDDRVAYDVLDYQIAASFQPGGVERESMRSRPRLRGCFITGRARLAIRVTGSNLTSLTLRLAADLDVHSVVSNELGPLLFFRMLGRGNVVVSLPSGVPPIGAEFTIEMEYSGLLEAQELDENWMGRQGFGLDAVGASTVFGIRRAPLHLQQLDPLVSAVGHVGFRHGDDGSDGARRLRGRRERRAGRRQPAGRVATRRRGRRDAPLPVRHGSACALSLVRDQSVRAGCDRRADGDAGCGAGDGGAAAPRRVLRQRPPGRGVERAFPGTGSSTSTTTLQTSSASTRRSSATCRTRRSRSP